MNNSDRLFTAIVMDLIIGLSKVVRAFSSLLVRLLESERQLEALQRSQGETINLKDDEIPK